MIYNFNSSDRGLIDFANFKGGLLNPNKKFCNKITFLKNVDKLYLGIPTLLQSNDKKLNLMNKFHIDKNLIQKKLFLIDNKKYPPFTNFIKQGTFYCESNSVKKKYYKKFNLIIKHNLELKKYIKKLKKKNLKVCAFQTRNIPHLGHEKILEHILKFCDHVVINPIIGLRKKGDINNFFLFKSFNFLIKKKFNNKVSFFPVISNMYYAGPREALHHLLIRQNLGFDFFSVGRDHAGAFGEYKPLDAIKLIKKFSKNFKIKTIFHSGAYFCKKCKKIVISNNDLKHKKYFRNISGSEFRKSLIRKKIYKFADKDLQEYLANFKKNFFIK
jgi:sulfate adenylyltransferase